jgi:hypothetical protein
MDDELEDIKGERTGAKAEGDSKIRERGSQKVTKRATHTGEEK